MIVLSLFHTHLETTEGNYNGKMGKQYFNVTRFYQIFFLGHKNFFMGLKIINFNSSKKVLRKKGRIKKKAFFCSTYISK